jgi:hypothetical protein
MSYDIVYIPMGACAIVSPLRKVETATYTLFHFLSQSYLLTFQTVVHIRSFPFPYKQLLIPNAKGQV